MNGLSRSTVASNSAAGRDPDWVQTRQSCRKGPFGLFQRQQGAYLLEYFLRRTKNSTEIFVASSWIEV